MKHKMWSRLLSMALAVMMITSIVPNSAFAEAASEITNSTSQVQVEETPVVENDVPQDEVTVPEEETPVESVEPTAEPTADPTAEPTAEPTQAPEATAVPSEQPSAEPTAAPEATETPNASAQPSETPVPSESPAPSATPAPSASPLPSETPVPTETPAATEEPVAMNEEAYETTVNVEGADITVTVNVPAGALPVDAKLVAQMIAQDSEEYAEVEAALADETLNEQPVEYDGMIALDIRFEMNGEEIEPAQPVEVTIDAKAMLPEDADPETVAVQHLEENENGEVTAVKTVADATEATGDATVEVTQTGETAMDMVSTFAVEEFSPYAVTYARRPGRSDWNNINLVNELSVDFYVNLYSNIANSDTSAGDTDEKNFTTSVFNTDISEHPNNFQYKTTSNGEYVVIQGATDGSAFEVDSDIRLLQKGYWGANNWGENTPFKLADFPTDQEVFEKIRNGWDEYTKGKGIKIGNYEVKPGELTTQNYAIRWYVFKLNSTDNWHIDGILVPKYGQLTVTKTFENANDVLDEIAEDFEISVSGKKGSWEQNYTLKLTPKSDNDPSGVLGYTDITTSGNSTTYTWTFDVLDATYTIKESGGDVDEWISSATYEVTADGRKESGAYTENGVEIDCAVWGNDEQAKTQRVDLTNTYEHVLTTLTLTKEFVGLTDEDVYYLLFNQKDPTDHENQFAFDINYCWGTKVVGSTTNSREWNRIKEIAKQPNGEELGDGGDFKVYPCDLLKKVSGSQDLKNASNPELGATLEKNKQGNWVYTQVIRVPVCGEDCYYTVFEQHAELPGYAKQGAKSTSWSVVDYSTGGVIHSGVGKAVSPYSEEIDDGPVDEEKMLANHKFYELDIQSPTTVSFTNRYTGNMEIRKVVTGVPEGTEGLDDATYTIVIEPAHPSKLVDSANNGPSFAGKSFTLIRNDGNEQPMRFNEHGQAEITLEADETVRLENLPAIQYEITENISNMAQIDDYVFKNASVAEVYPEEVSEAKDHWNQYDPETDTDIFTGKDDLSDGLVAVDVKHPESLTSRVTVTNVYEKATGTLIIQKTVTGLENDSKALDELKNELIFTVNGPEGYTSQTIPAKDPDQVQWSGAVATITLNKVPVGKYTVTETGHNGVEGYIWQNAKSTTTAEGTVKKGQPTTLELKNEYTPANGDLLIGKTLTGINITMGDDVTFIFKITGPTDKTGVTPKTYYRYLTFSKDDFESAQSDGSVTKQVWLEDVPVGTYTVTELKAAGYTCDGSYTQSGVVTSSEVTDAQVKFTNNPVTDDPTPGDQDFVENRFNWDVKQKKWVWVQAYENQNEKGSN